MSNIAQYRAAFIDRDGTIIEQVELLHDPRQVRLLSGAAEGIRLFNENGIKIIVVTNQPVVARGISGLEDVENVHAFLSEKLWEQGARVDAYYFCPHHINANVKNFRLECTCRKPKPGMLFAAAREHALDLSMSVMIGDTTQDVLAGRNAGVKTMLVRTGHGGRDPWQYDVTPDFYVADLHAAACLWLRENRID